MTVIPFPSDRPRRSTDLSAPAVILVLPVVRIERYDDEIQELADNHYALVGRPAEELVRRSINLLRRARSGAPDPLDGDGGAV